MHFIGLQFYSASNWLVANWVCEVIGFETQSRFFLCLMHELFNVALLLPPLWLL